MLLGLTLLCSHVLLSYGTVKERRQPITVFLLVSLGVLLGYWGWAGYVKYGMLDNQAYQEVM